MKHSREDYNRIQDPAGLIPDDEPVFLLRGQDAAAPAAIRRWCEVQFHMGGDVEMMQLANAHAKAMEEWQRLHKVKVADLPAVHDNSEMVTVDGREVLRRLLMNLVSRGDVAEPRWVGVKRALGFGRTMSRAVCIANGFEPDELLPVWTSELEGAE